MSIPVLLLFLLFGIVSGIPLIPSNIARGLGLSRATNSTNGTIYPQKTAGDAPYSIPEADLKAAVKLPVGWTAGGKMAVILVPGTAVTGTDTYTDNFVNFLSDSSTMEPVLLDVPNNLLDDIQLNAEFVAYSMNYVSMMADNKNVSVVTWSQGSIDMQWALKYWPSTRAIVTDFVAISPDINGSAGGSGNAFINSIPVPPSLLQQKSTSRLIATLRANGGDSAYVPTTTIYSSADQVVIPQVGKNASGFFKSDNGVPAANYQVQVACGADTPGGGNFSHEQMIYNPFTVAIAMDAFANPGPGDSTRLDLKQVCSTDLAAGMTAYDRNATDSATGVTTSNIFSFEFSSGLAVSVEPDIKDYAKKDCPQGKKAVHIISINSTHNAVAS